jgi:hypothetical protein
MIYYKYNEPQYIAYCLFRKLKISDATQYIYPQFDIYFHFELLQIPVLTLK